MKLLEIQSSPRGESSDSITLTKSFIEACKSDNTSIVVDRLNVWHERLSGEKQFWRIVNASPDLYADLEVDSESLTVVAFDGMPLTYHDPNRHKEKLRHVPLAPAGRAEVIVEGPKRGGIPSLRSLRQHWR